MIDKFKQFKVASDLDDSAQFIEIVEKIISGMIIKLEIDEVSIIKIKNWFDHKWLNYSGKGLVHNELTRNSDKIAIDNFWKDKITVPPFTPNRVISEYFYRRKETGNKVFEKLLHTKKRSTDNQNNRIASKSENGLLFGFRQKL